MTATPQAIRRVGIGQFVLASAFVLWLYFVGGESFAWPVAPRLTAIFLGTSFILRSFLGLRIILEPRWYRLRWAVWGNYAFLGVILTSTFWHAGEMNWKANIILAHVWILIYIFEPLVLPFLGPFEPGKDDPVPAAAAEGPVLNGLRRTLIALVMVGATIAGLLFINPAFMSTRWPWPLDPFDARIMAAWPAAAAVWAGTMARAKDWVEIKMGIQGLTLYGAALFVAWVVALPLYDPARNNIYSYGVLTGLFAALLGYFYWRQERQRSARRVEAPAAA